MSMTGYTGTVLVSLIAGQSMFPQAKSEASKEDNLNCQTNTNGLCIGDEVWTGGWKETCILEEMVPWIKLIV